MRVRSEGDAGTGTSASVLQVRVHTPLLADTMCSRELVAAPGENERGRRPSRCRRSCLAPRNGARARRLSVVEARTPLTPYVAHSCCVTCWEREHVATPHAALSWHKKRASRQRIHTGCALCCSHAHHIALKHAIKVRRRPTATRQRRVGAAPMREHATRRA